jgi:hypothetical protein
MATWLGELNVATTAQRSEDPLVSGIKQLAVRLVFGLLIFLVTTALLPHLTYFKGDAMLGWRSSLPVLLLVLTVISLPASVLLIAVVLGWATLYESPAAAIWFVFMLLLVIGVYEDQREHALLLASTPGLLLLNLGFLPTFLIGIFYGAKRGLMNGFGCLVAIAIASVLGFTAYPSTPGNDSTGIVLTGFETRQPSLLGSGQRLDTPNGILDFGWLEVGRSEGGSLTLEGGTQAVASFAERWANALGRSPVALALPLLWGLVAIVVSQTRLASHLLLERMGGSEWKNTLLSQGVAILIGATLFFVGYMIVAPSALHPGFWVQLFWSGLWAGAIVIVGSAFRLFVDERRSWPTWIPQLLGYVQRLPQRTPTPARPADSSQG